MRARRIIALGLFAGGWAAVLGCEGDGVAPNNGDPDFLDAGFFSRDSGHDIPDVGFHIRDATTFPDAQTPDAGMPCVCPSFNPSCSAVVPETPAFSPEQGALLQQLYSVLACSDTSLHIAMYQTDWSCIVDAIGAKLSADPDLSVELVIDDDQCPRTAGVLGCPLAALDGHPRVAIVDDARAAYMHDKFVVADGRMVWVSSANFTREAFCVESNDGIVVTTSSITQAYEARFQQMFADHRFGPTMRTPPVSRTPYTVYFGPESPLDTPSTWFNDLVTAIDTASVSVDFLTFAWTRTEVSDAMLRAARRGIPVRGVVPALYKGEAPTQALLAAQLPVRVGEVHDKLLIVDGKTVLTGSANWSENSWANDENVLRIEDRGIAAQYTAGFLRAYGRAH
ncbi:MAG: phospholipase D-like domain-containing protein [Myxococcota bacterium]